MENTHHKQDKLAWLLFGVLGGIAGLMLGVMIDFHKATKPTIQDSTSQETIQQLCDKNHIKFSHIVIAQIKLENGLKRDSLGNNPLNMRVAAQRYSFAINSYDYGNYSKYSSIEDAIKDYKSWQIQNAFWTITEDDYYKVLLSFAKDPDYIKKLKSLVE